MELDNTYNTDWWEMETSTTISHSFKTPSWNQPHHNKLLLKKRKEEKFLKNPKEICRHLAKSLGKQSSIAFISTTMWHVQAPLKCKFRDDQYNCAHGLYNPYAASH